MIKIFLHTLTLTQNFAIGILVGMYFFSLGISTYWLLPAMPFMAAYNYFSTIFFINLIEKYL